MAKRITSIGLVAVLTAISGAVAVGACGVSGGSGDCTTLPSCCSQLSDLSNKDLCTRVVQTADATSCSEAQADFEGDGLCVVTSSPGGGGGTGCSGLSSCCGSLPSAEQGGCGAIVNEGSDTTCSAELSAYQHAGYCSSGGTGPGTGGTGCSGLSSCCSSLSAAYQPSCNALVSSGVDSSCSAELTVYKDEGMCGGSGGTGTGTGTGGGSGCSALSSCCSSLAAAYQPSCNSLVSSGVDSSCSAELTVYMDEGMCGGSTGTGTGSGGGGCSALSACCANLSSAYQPSCDSLVSSGVDSSCSAELSVYKGDGMCQ